MKMRIASTSPVYLAVFLKFIESSSQFDCLPNGEPLSGVPHSKLTPSFSSGRAHASESSIFSAEPSSRSRSRSPAARCIAPPTRINSMSGTMYDLEHLESIRLTPIMNPNRLFVLRRYTFPVNERIKLLGENRKYLPIPNHEHIVLSTSDGEVVAILEDSHHLAGLYGFSGKKRVKANIVSGTFTPMTVEEINEVPVCTRRKIVMYFRVECVNHNPSYDTSN